MQPYLRRRRAPAPIALLFCLASPASAARASLRAPALQPELTAAPTSRVCASDEQLVSQRLGGSGNTSAHVMRETLESLGAPNINPDASSLQLQAQLASALRVQMSLEGMATLDNVTALRMALGSRGEAFVDSETSSALLGRLVERLNQECFLVDPKRPIVQSLNLEDLQSAAYERLLTSTGTRTVLIHRLHTFQVDCDRMVEAIPGFACTMGQIEDALRGRGLSTVCSKEECLARLVEGISQGSSAAVQSELCDIVADGAICLGGGKRVLTTDAAAQGLVAHYTFDQLKGLDSSGNKNHAKVAPVNYGAGVGGHGMAAKFTGGTDYVEIRNHQKYTEAGNTFTVEMWLYLRQDSTGDWRTVMHKGTTDEERTPILFLEPLTRGIEFFVSTTDASQPKGERLWSNSFIPLHRWTHVACVAEGNSLRLYVNGLLDSENTTVGSIVQNTGPFFLGGDPWRPAGGFDGYIDEFKFYSRALTTDEIGASAAPALGGVEPSFVELGCMGCAVDTAGSTCRMGYHLCNLRDLYAGGYQVARAMGWATSNSHVWTAEEYAAGGGVNASWAGSAPGMVKAGLGLCCADNE